MKPGDIFDQFYFTESEIMRIFTQICEAVLKLHENLKVIHFDLRTNNILMDKERNPVVTDFSTCMRIPD